MQNPLPDHCHGYKRSGYRQEIDALPKLRQTAACMNSKCEEKGKHERGRNNQHRHEKRIPHAFSKVITLPETDIVVPANKVNRVRSAQFPIRKAHHDGSDHRENEENQEASHRRREHQRIGDPRFAGKETKPSFLHKGASCSSAESDDRRIRRPFSSKIKARLQSGRNA